MNFRVALLKVSLLIASFSVGVQAQASGRSAVSGTTLKGAVDCGFAGTFPWSDSYKEEHEGRLCSVTIKFHASTPESSNFTYIVDGDMMFDGTYKENGGFVYLKFNASDPNVRRVLKVIRFADVVDSTGELRLVGGYTKP